MRRIADRRQPGPVRVYIGAAPRMIYQTRYFEESGIPAGVEYVTYATAFGDHERPYDWSQIVDTIDALVIPCRPKKPGSAVHILGPTARLELRSLVAHKPVLLYSRKFGLVPVIDCLSQVLPPTDAPRLKLTIPRAWNPSCAPTLAAAVHAMTPRPQTKATPRDLERVAM
ncbi:hypothetical protein [Streptomyces sp. V1I6]|uniref:hypothetical protein n=1 Tax=Streptomyces sp. V1I6 TaxID=3042273 RepID=UPI0027D77862|nr:hypothetical protein [Streptomyces sp. V1I6]